MKSTLKFFNFLFIITLMISCGGGGEEGGTGNSGGGGNSNPPGKATLIAPANNKACETGTSVSDTQSEVTFNWNSSAKTSTYDLKITNLNTNISALNKTGITSTTTKGTLNKGIPYSWNITSKNTSSSTNTVSETWKFYLKGPGIVNYAPFPAVIKEPNESIVQRDNQGKVTFSWEGSDPDNDDLRYTLYVDKTDGKQSPPSSQSNLTVKTLSIFLDSNTNYFCRVKTFDGVNSSFSTIYKFKTE